MIDVLVVYSSGTYRDRMNLVNLCIYQTNLALSNSGSNARLRLVGVRYHSYTEGQDGSVTLDQLEGKNDGELDDVHGWRSDYGADLVHYIGDITSYTGNAGIGGSFAATDPDFAALAGTYTFAHNWAHNMGCDHDIANSDNKTGYNHGYLGDGIRTIMTSNYDRTEATNTWIYGGDRILQFSNLVNTYNGQPVGDAATANCARTINENAQSVHDRMSEPVFRVRNSVCFTILLIFVHVAFF